MKFGYTIVYVDDVEKTIDFYERAFGVQRRFVHESNEYGEIDTGTTTLAFSQDSLAENITGIAHTKNIANAAPNGFELAFLTEDVHAAYTHCIAQGAFPVKSPEIKPWGQTVAYVRDENGVLIEIATPMS